MFTLKKSLGQHFLRDENICRKIISTLMERPFRRLLEVGPGGGALTKYLIQLKDIEFKAVELDDEKITYLLNTWPQLEGKITQKDFLVLPKPFDQPFTIIGNFPYNISSQILFKILDWRPDVETVLGMFQKELAERVEAREGSKLYGVISVLIQAFFRVEYLFEVSEKSFQPPPRVKSAVIRLSPVKEELIMRSEKDFFLLVKTAFNQRRKKLRNAVKSLFATGELEHPIFDKRAEQLPVADFAALTFRMK
jgi:16S rRNA (adenine1518-N6/adenine1519-N6)-dimethyltransferase